MSLLVVKFISCVRVGLFLCETYFHPSEILARFLTDFRVLYLCLPNLSFLFIISYGNQVNPFGTPLHKYVNDKIYFTLAL